MPAPWIPGMAGISSPLSYGFFSAVLPGRKSPSAYKTQTGATPGWWKPPVYRPHKKTSPSSLAFHAPPPIVARSSPFPGLSSPTAESCCRRHRCCLPPPVTPPRTPSGGPPRPPPHCRWWATMYLPMLCLSLRGRVLRSTILPDPPYGSAPNTCVGSGGT